MMEVHELHTAKFYATYKHHVQFMLFHVWAHLSYKLHIKMCTCIKHKIYYLE
jgi:hypothetical protein